MTSIKNQLRQARPNLRLVSPLTHWTMWVMAIFNIVLGASFIFAIDDDRFSAPLLIVNEIFTFDFWGVVFIAIGLLKLYALLMNSWDLARKSLIIGVSIKAAWAIALTVRTFTSPGTAVLNLLWVTVALLQMGTYIWFVPAHLSNKQGKNNE